MKPLVWCLSAIFLAQLPSTMESGAFMFPHRNTKKITISSMFTNLTTIKTETTSLQTTPLMSSTTWTPSRTSPSLKLISPTFLSPLQLETNLSLPIGSTARFHCTVANVEQEQVESNKQNDELVKTYKLMKDIKTHRR